VDEAEIEAVSAAMREGLFSRFVGSNLPGTREALRKTSEELRDVEGAFSFLGGPNVRRFEADWARLHDVPYAISVNSATSGLTAILMSMDIGPGAEVITTPLSFTATATAIVAAQATPVFADIDAETLCLSPESVERCIGPATKAILAVHWCGNAGDFAQILEVARRHGIPVIEDSAQAPGTQYQGRALGAWGAAGVFSFSEPKNVMTGEGGMIITSDVRIAEKCRLIRNHGEAVPTSADDEEFLRNVVGYNFRMVEIVAAMGWVQTARLPELNAIRNRNYLHLVAQLTDMPGLTPQRVTHLETFAAYTAVFRWDAEATGVSRDAVAMALRKEGIPVATGVGRLMSDHPMFLKKIAYGAGGWPFLPHVDYDPARLPVAHRVHDEEYLGFFLMGWPNELSDMDDIARALKKVAENLPQLATFEKANPGSLVSSDRGRGR
jgi:dTDP-4-amino-4,6-dideoxygalactose transaminase